VGEGVGEGVAVGDGVGVAGAVAVVVGAVPLTCCGHAEGDGAEATTTTHTCLNAPDELA
jgi:hypothetical protein